MSPEPILVTPDDNAVNLEWELLRLTGDNPAFAIYVQVRDDREPPLSQWESLDHAWISITSSMLTAAPRVLVTPAELDAIADLCRRFASALRARNK